MSRTSTEVCSDVRQIEELIDRGFVPDGKTEHRVPPRGATWDRLVQLRKRDEVVRLHISRSVWEELSAVEWFPLSAD